MQKKSLGCFFFFFEVILLTEGLLASPDTDNKRITGTMATHAAVAESVLQREIPVTQVKIALSYNIMKQCPGQ